MCLDVKSPIVLLERHEYEVMYFIQHKRIENILFEVYNFINRTENNISFKVTYLRGPIISGKSLFFISQGYLHLYIEL